jgi:hypothetical protein
MRVLGKRVHWGLVNGLGYWPDNEYVLPYLLSGQIVGQYTIGLLLKGYQNTFKHVRSHYL